MKAKPKGSQTSSTDVGRIDLGAISQLLDFMAEHGLEEFEYETSNIRLRLKKPSANSHSYGVRTVPPPEIHVASSAPYHNPVAPAAPKDEASEAGRAEDLHIVKSPIVGTFYEAPSPGAQAFVKPGDRVEIGQVLCIVEAMKLMNEIESDVAGEIVRIYVENGQPVEYGESLFAIRPARKK